MGRNWIPGLASAGAAVAVAWAVNRMWPAVSPLTAGVALGILAANALPAPARARLRPGWQVAAKRVMRLGIVMLGLQLALGDVLRLGWRTLAVVVAVVFATFFGTRWLGERMGLPGRQALLIATGFAICGASAVAAMEGVTRRGEADDDPDPVVAVALVTLCGSLAIAVLPMLRGPLGLGDAAFGHWVGASVHDVGQVVATASVGGAVALQGAVVVKLMRVAMLAPMVAGTALAERRRGGRAASGGLRVSVASGCSRSAAASASLPAAASASGSATALASIPVATSASGSATALASLPVATSASGSDTASASLPAAASASGSDTASASLPAATSASGSAADDPGGAAPSPSASAKNPPIMPLFVAGFLAMIALRTTGWLPTAAVTHAKQLQDLLLAAGMFGLGSGVRLRDLARTGPRPLALGLASWVLIASGAYIGVRVAS